MAFVILGLGNTGKEYEKTRHNAGRLAVQLFAMQEGFPAFEYRKGADALISEGTIEGEKVVLVLPETMMNRSGKSAAALVKSVKAAKQLVVVQDELDLPLGTLKMVYGRNSGGHKGVESVMRAVRTKEFTRLRIGISGRGKKHQAKKPVGNAKVTQYVVAKFRPADDALLKKTLKKAASALHTFIVEGREQATMEANTR